MAEKAPVIADYLDYRLFLKDYYQFKRQTEILGRRRYNYTAFAAAADIKSPNYLKLVIEGQRNLSPEMAVKFARAFGLEKASETDFRMLVSYNQEADPLERSRKLQALADYRLHRKTESGEVPQRAVDLMPSWITWVLHQMADQKGVDISNKKQVTELIRGNLKGHSIDEAYESLLKAGVFDRCEKTGQIRKTKNFIESPESIPFEVVRKLQSELIYLGLESLFKDQSSEREFGAVSLSLTEKEFEQLRFELRKIRKAYGREIAAKRSESPGERVYQLNIQLFPLTDVVKNQGPVKAPEERGERGEKETISTTPPAVAPDLPL